jgi:hypothetical protein
VEEKEEEEEEEEEQHQQEDEHLLWVNEKEFVSLLPKSQFVKKKKKKKGEVKAWLHEQWMIYSHCCFCYKVICLSFSSVLFPEDF